MVWRHALLAAVCLSTPADAQFNRDTWCMATADCQSLVTRVLEDVRQLVSDRVQSKSEGLFGVAHTGLQMTGSKFNDSLLGVVMSAVNRRGRPNSEELVEHFWHQLNQLPEVDWLYFGEEATGRWISVRRPYECELTKSCDYRADGLTTEQPLGANIPTVAANSVVRVDTTEASGHTQVEGWPTTFATGSAKVGSQYLYRQTYTTRERPWYKTAVAASAGVTVWEQPYIWTGGSIGITAMRRITAPDGTTLGVLGADYKLTTLSNYLVNVVTNPETVVYLVAADGRLVASNKNVPTLGLARDAMNDVIKNTASPALATLGSSPDWERAASAYQRGSAIVQGQLYNWDTIGIVDLQWLIVVASPELTSRVSYAPTPEYGCFTRFSCVALLLANNGYVRDLQIQQFAEEAKEYLDTTNTVLNIVEASYNNGEMHTDCTPQLDGDVKCGTLDWANQPERDTVRAHLKSLIKLYDPAAWLYAALTSRHVIGYRRENNELQLWQTCEGTPAGCDSGTAFWRDDARTQLVESNPTGEFWKRDWYTIPTNKVMGIDEVAWTEPYVFVDGSVGVTLTKKLYNGDWGSETPSAIVATDVLMSHFSDKLKNMTVGARTMLYVMSIQSVSTRGMLVASNRPEQAQPGKVLPFAQDSQHYLIRQSSKVVLAAERRFIGPAGGYNILGENTTNTWVINAQRVQSDTFTTPGAVTTDQYNYIMVMCTPEEDIHQIVLPDAAGALQASIATLLAGAALALATLV